MDLVPESKFDLERAERAVAAGWPAIEPVLADLLEWLQGYQLAGRARSRAVPRVDR